MNADVPGLVLSAQQKVDENFTREESTDVSSTCLHSPM